MKLAPNSEGLRESNDCHDPDDGRFCSDGPQGGKRLRLKAWQPAPQDDVRPAFTFESQVGQYPETGPAGVGYFKGEIDAEHHVDTLLYRDRTGKVRGILNRYPMDFVLDPRSGALLSNDPLKRVKAGRTPGGRMRISLPVLVEKAGNVNILVDPTARRQGIATQLYQMAEQRWGIDPRQQSYTTEGRKFYQSLTRARKRT